MATHSDRLYCGRCHDTKVAQAGANDDTPPTSGGKKEKAKKGKK